jgi:hypothetical protein
MAIGCAGLILTAQSDIVSDGVVTGSAQIPATVSPS